MLNIFEILLFIWLGVYSHIISLGKQILFQGQDLHKSIKNIKWVASVLGLAVVAQTTWLFDAFIRQKMKMSEFFGHSGIITAPVSAVAFLAILLYSERNLGDTINWTGAIVYSIGLILTIIGGRMLLVK